MSEFLDKLKKNSTIKEADILSKSKFFGKNDIITTGIPAINVALSGKLSGGFVPGLTIFAGPSKHFKTSFSLVLAKAYLDKYPEGIMIFYDSEFGTPQDYFESFGIDMTRVLHTPVKNVEEFKFDIMKQLEMITRDDKVIILVDSIGNLASKKECDDALDANAVADMSRAKALKGLSRMVTPYLATKDIPMVAVNHTYQTQEKFSKAVVSGGTGLYYSASNIFIVGRSQEKEEKEIIGYSFIINVEKSRFVREKSKIEITVMYDGGISKWSGLMEMALESGHVVKPNMGWYSKLDPSTGEIEAKRWRLKDTNCKEFWMTILMDKSFQKWVEDNYRLVTTDMMPTEE